MRTECVAADREKVLGQLMAGFKRDEALSLSQLAELEAQLNPDELRICGDTLVVLKTGSLFSEKKILQAYNALLDGLRRMPTSLSLQQVRDFMLRAAPSALSDLMHQDALNPMIELLYDTLKRESALNIWHHFEYLKFLVGHQRFAEARKLAVPLVNLSPRLLGLREQVEIIAQKTQDRQLIDYLIEPPARIGRPYVKIDLTAKEVYIMKEKLSVLRKALLGDTPVQVIERHLAEVIGKMESDGPLNSNLKELYYIWAIVEGRKGNYFESLQMFRSLVEMDPCSLAFRQSVDLEMDNICNHFTEQAEKNTLKVDLEKAYEVLREIGHVSYRLLAQVGIAEVKSGHLEKAKQKMHHLVSLNPFDSDYVGAAQMVAEAAKDSNWIGELNRMMTRISEERPWDLGLQMKLDESEMAVA